MIVSEKQILVPGCSVYCQLKFIILCSSNNSDRCKYKDNLRALSIIFLLYLLHFSFDEFNTLEQYWGQWEQSRTKKKFEFFEKWGASEKSFFAFPGALLVLLTWNFGTIFGTIRTIQNNKKIWVFRKMGGH